MVDGLYFQEWQIVGSQAAGRSGFAYGAQYPSLEMTIEGEDLTGAERQVLASGLIAALPSLRLAADWAARLDAKDVNGFAEVAQLLLLAIFHLQQDAGVPVFEIGRILCTAEAQARVLIPLSADSYQLIFEIMNWLVQACGLLRSGQLMKDHAKGLLPLLDQLHSRFGTDAVSHHFIAAALRAGVPFVELPEKVIQYGQGHLARRMLHSLTNATSNIAVHLSRLKHSAAKILAEAGIPVPAHHLVRDEAAALRAAELLGYPVVVKPADCDGGIAVSTDLRTPAEVSSAFAIALSKSGNILVEKHVQGKDYRVTVFQGQAIWAVERLPGGVIGDGQTSIGGLLEQLNGDPSRKTSADAPLKPIPFDNEARALLDQAGLSESSVPKAGEFIRLRRAANIASGGVPIAVFDKVHPDNAQLAVRAADAMGLDLAGVDLLIPDIAKSWLETEAAICEVNAGPGIGQVTSAHLYGPILASLVHGTGRVPVILIIGDAPDSPLDCMVTKGLHLSDMMIGYQDRFGVRVGNERLTRGPVHNFYGGRILSRDRRVEAVIMNVSDDGLLETGLPFPRYDLLIIAGKSLTAANPKRSRPPEDIAKDLFLALLPACDGNVVRLPESEAPLDGFQLMTDANWHGIPAPSKIEAFLRSEIMRLAKAHQKTAYSPI